MIRKIPPYTIGTLNPNSHHYPLKLPCISKPIMSALTYDFETAVAGQLPRGVLSAGGEESGIVQSAALQHQCVFLSVHLHVNVLSGLQLFVALQPVTIATNQH